MNGIGMFSGLNKAGFSYNAGSGTGLSNSSSMPSNSTGELPDGASPLSEKTPGFVTPEERFDQVQIAGLKKEDDPLKELMKKNEDCHTCDNRTYQDGSDDAGVSYQAPTKISPNAAASAVASHENEHVVREQAKAHRENKRVVSQTVTYQSAVCPECHRTYVSGGTTRTVTKTRPDTASDMAARATGIGTRLNAYA